MHHWTQVLGMIAAVVLPLWNIPLIYRMIQRKSSEDISVAWALGVWICFVLMAPSGFTSQDKVWKVFNIVNFFLFSIVVFFVVFFRRKKK